MKLFIRPFLTNEGSKRKKMLCWIKYGVRPPWEASQGQLSSGGGGRAWGKIRCGARGFGGPSRVRDGCDRCCSGKSAVEREREGERFQVI